MNIQNLIISSIQSWKTPRSASMVRKSAMMRHWSHGPSCLDHNAWRMLLTSFKSSSTDLCKTIAKLAKCIASSHLTFLFSHNSCRFVALDKCPGLQPIGSGEVLTRTIRRPIVKCIKTNLKILGDDHDQQLCMGRQGGIKHEIIQWELRLKHRIRSDLAYRQEKWFQSSQLWYYHKRPFEIMPFSL